MFSVTDIIWKVVPPVASGAVGVVGTIYQLTKKLEDRVKNLETVRVQNLEDSFRKFEEKTYQKDLAALKTLYDELKKNVEKDFEDLYGELRGRARERIDARRLQAKLSERYFALESRVEHCEKSINELNDSFVQFSKGQQEQWQEISRALGNIEGWIRGMMSRRISGEFPGPLKK